MDHSLVNSLWVLVCAALVFQMQCGFLCLESGLTRSKNAISVAVKNAADFAVSFFLFWLVGFGLMFGATQSGWLGTSLFAPSLVDRGSHDTATFFFFQATFCATAATIISGAVAERMRFGAYVLCTVCVSGFIYPLFGHWAWAGAIEGHAQGWLARLGFIDFAGATVVHLVGGTAALAAAIVIGPRQGRFDGGQVAPGSNVPMAMLGTLLLWLGWIGFNGGSKGVFDSQISGIICNTFIGGTAGMLVAILLSCTIKRYADVGLAINGSLAGLVSVTAGCHVYSSWSSACIGAIGAGVMLLAYWSLDRLRVDDAIGAFPVHGAAGAWGTLAVGIFAHHDLLALEVSRVGQTQVQLIGVCVAAAVTFVPTFSVLRLAGRRFSLRVTPEQEEMGLNASEHGASTELFDLMQEMQQHRDTGDFARPVSVEHGSEVGKIAHQYNRVLARVASETERAARMASDANHARRDAEATAAELRNQAQELGLLNQALECEVDEHRRTAAMLMDQQQQLTNIKHAIDAFAIVAETDALGRITYVNDAFCEISQYSREELIGKDHRIVNSGQHSKAFFNNMWATIQAGKVWRGEIANRTKNGDLYWLDATIVPVLGEKGRPESFLAIRIDITNRKRSEQEREKLHQDLAAASHQAGMAEVATGVLHNVGNALNSVNVSTTLMYETVRDGHLDKLAAASDIVQANQSNLAQFFGSQQGQAFPSYLAQAVQQLTDEREALLCELGELANSVEHIREIVSMQQNFAKSGGVRQEVFLEELMEDALKINDAGLIRHGVDIERDYQTNRAIMIEKHKVVQVLVNLISNAKYAVSDSPAGKSQVTLRIVPSDNDRVRFEVEDTGVGISDRDLPRLFEHGFTTKDDGHGFGLHSSANTAKELGGTLSAHSEGAGCGAVFTLELPMQYEEENTCSNSMAARAAS